MPTVHVYLSLVQGGPEFSKKSIRNGIDTVVLALRRRRRPHHHPETSVGEKENEDDCNNEDDGEVHWFLRGSLGIESRLSTAGHFNGAALLAVPFSD